MADKSIEDIAKKMRDIDICFLNTRTEGDQIASRPMSNNAQVEYDGDSYYFSYDDARTISDIEADPRVSLSFAGKHYFYVAVEGQAAVIRDKEAFEEHWSKDLDRWFEDGVDTPGLVMIKVEADLIKYWDKNEDGEIRV